MSNLREEIAEKIMEAVHRASMMQRGKTTNPGMFDKDADQILALVKQFLLKEMPERVSPKRKSDISEVMSASGFNWALKEVHIAINEVLGGEANE